MAHAAFVAYVNTFNQSICGGTISESQLFTTIHSNSLNSHQFQVSQNYILTCAHCIMAIKNVYKWNVVITVGRNNISAPMYRDTIYADVYKISSAVLHKGYKHETNINDIALVRTARYIKFK